jgi:hypothetical protein
VCPRFSGCGATAQGHGPPKRASSIAPAPRRSAESWSRAHEPRQATPGLARLVNGEATAHSAGRWQLDRRLWERWATALRVYRARNPTTLAAAHRAPLFERSPRPPVLQYPPASAESPASGEWQPIRRVFSGDAAPAARLSSARAQPGPPSFRSLSAHRTGGSDAAERHARTRHPRAHAEGASAGLRVHGADRRPPGRARPVDVGRRRYRLVMHPLAARDREGPTRRTEGALGAGADLADGDPPRSGSAGRSLTRATALPVASSRPAPAPSSAKDDGERLPGWYPALPPARSSP